MAARLALRAVAHAIRDGLREDGEVRLANFGTFRLRTCRPRRLLLPGTDRECLLPERRQLRFTSQQKNRRDRPDSHSPNTAATSRS